MDTSEKGSEVELEQEQGQDDDLLSTPSSVSRSETPEDLVISTISRPLALSLATVFEDLSDKLTLVGYTLPTLPVDARTRESIDYTLEHNTARLHEASSMDKDDQGGWLLHQHHASKIPRRLGYIVNPASQNRQSATDIMKRSGIKCTTQPEKTQKIRVQIQIMANVIISELVAAGTFDSLKQQIEMENKEKMAREEQFKKINMYKQYIHSFKAAIKESRQEQEEQTTLQRLEIHNLTDLLLEQDIRSGLEDKFVRKYGAARVSARQKTNNSREARKSEELQKISRRMQLEDVVHDSMMTIIRGKFQETTALHDAAVEKYEKDFFRMNSELDALITARKRDLQRIAWLQRRIVDYERIVFDDRRIKKREADKMQKKINENKKATKIQAWWRGIMVRKWLGHYMELFAQLIEARAKRREAKANPKGRSRPKK